MPNAKENEESFSGLHEQRGDHDEVLERHHACLDSRIWDKHPDFRLVGSQRSEQATSRAIEY